MTAHGPQYPATSLLNQNEILRTMDNCTKCGLCQTFCPVVSVTEQFPGPKVVGPQAQRFRSIESLSDSSTALCNGCGICTSVCPNGVAISDIITIAKAQTIDRDKSLGLAQRILNRPETIGRLLGRFPVVGNGILNNVALRTIGQHVFGIGKNAPLPHISGRQFRRWYRTHKQRQGERVSYFTGCSVEYFEAGTGVAAVKLLNHLGYEVTAPTNRCCSLPMLSSGEWSSAVRPARDLINDLRSNASDELAIVSTSTSCALTIRAKYKAYLEMDDYDARKVAKSVVDICHFLLIHRGEDLRKLLKPMEGLVIYHGPCQLRNQEIGFPAIELLKMIPGLSVKVSVADCCGIGGTYGYLEGRGEISSAIGTKLFDQVEAVGPDLIVCDSETCRWNIQKNTGIPSRHPIEVVLNSLEGKTIREVESPSLA